MKDYSGIVKLVAGIFAGVIVVSATSVGTVMGIRNMAEKQKVEQERNLEKQEDGTSKATAETGSASSKETPETETTVVGWVESDFGWKYHQKNGEPIAGQWQEVDGYLYYFRRDGLMQEGQLRLGRQLFSFDQSGRLMRIEHQSDGAWYEEDVKYYAVGNVLYQSLPDGSKSSELYHGVNSGQQEGGISFICSEGDSVYYYGSEDRLVHRISKSGKELSKSEDNGHMFPKTMIAYQGDIYINDTNQDEGDADLPMGGLEKLENGITLVDEDCVSVFYSAVYHLLQGAGDWLYFQPQDYALFPEVGNFDRWIYRISTTDQTLQLVTNQPTDEFLVFEDSIYCMQEGILKRLSLEDQIEKMKPVQQNIDMMYAYEIAKREYCYNQESDYTETLTWEYYDLNQDGIPEMIAESSWCGIGIWTYEGGQVKQLFVDEAYGKSGREGNFITSYNAGHSSGGGSEYFRLNKKNEFELVLGTIWKNGVYYNSDHDLYYLYTSRPEGGIPDDYEGMDLREVSEEEYVNALDSMS